MHARPKKSAMGELRIWEGRVDRPLVGIVRWNDVRPSFEIGRWLKNVGEEREGVAGGNGPLGMGASNDV